MNKYIGSGELPGAHASRVRTGRLPGGRQRFLGGLAGLAVAGGLVAAASLAVGQSGAAQATTGVVPAAHVATSSVKAKAQSKSDVARRISTIPAGQQVQIGQYSWFETTGNLWAVTEKVPGQPVIQPFGWRATVGNSNLGDPTNSPGLGNNGSVYITVFKSSDVSRVIYTIDKKAYDAKVYRLAGIPGWVAATIELPKTAVAKKPKTGDPIADKSVAVYNKAGKVVGQFPSSR